jgi:hypothetical protein
MSRDLGCDEPSCLPTSLGGGWWLCKAALLSRRDWPQHCQPSVRGAFREGLLYLA